MSTQACHRSRAVTLSQFRGKAGRRQLHLHQLALPQFCYRVANHFGVDFFPDEGLMNHSIRTAVLDRQGKLVANIEGNLYSAAQLGDLIQTTLGR
jgi:hypothetical protein